MANSIDKVFEKMGLSKNQSGYFYFHTAVQLALKEPRILRRVTQTLYPAVAKKYGNTPAGIERAMSHTIKCAWSSETPNLLTKFRKKPTNRVFIGYVADLVYYKNEYDLYKKKMEESEKQRLTQPAALPFLE